MFNYLSGLVAELLPNIAVLDCGGIGFQINTSTYTISQIKVGEKAKLYTYVYIREDSFDIYGFCSRSEKRCFEMLLGVSGVGPKAALSILSVNSPEGLVMSILSENEKAITAAPGVGKKIAQRVILELKDKIAKDDNESIMSTSQSVATSSSVQGNKYAEAVEALTVLGYSVSEANTALKKIDLESLTLEEIIKSALKQMLR